jgi:hypothetical protein
VGAGDFGILAAIIGLAAYVVVTQLGRAWLFLKPLSLRLEPETPADQTKIPDSLSALARELGEQGFVLLGAHSEKAWRRPEVLAYDFVHSGDGTYASLWLSPTGERQLMFLTWTAQDAFLLTADHRRPVREHPGRYQSSYLENTNPARLFKAHSRRLEGQTGRGPPTLEGRMDAARAWLEGPGREEIRQQHFSGLLWTVSAVGLLAALAFRR